MLSALFSHFAHSRPIVSQFIWGGIYILLFCDAWYCEEYLLSGFLITQAFSPGEKKNLRIRPRLTQLERKEKRAVWYYSYLVQMVRLLKSADKWFPYWPDKLFYGSLSSSLLFFCWPCSIIATAVWMTIMGPWLHSGKAGRSHCFDSAAAAAVTWWPFQKKS